MKIGISISALMLVMGAVAYGQATPAASASPRSFFKLPAVDGTMHYALSASQVVQYGYFEPGAANYSAALSGDASYSSTSVKAPFNMLFAGGVFIPETSGQETSAFVNLAVSQDVIAEKWVFGISDSVSYLPQSPTTGLSGVPGVGDIGAYPVTGPSTGPAGGVLTYSGNRVSNDLAGNVERLFTGRTSLSGSGSWTILHFLNDDEGLGNSEVNGQVALNHRLDARDTISANADYSIFTFGPSEGGLSLTTRGINGVFSRVLSKTLSVNVSVGPQWVSSSDSDLIPEKMDLAVSAGLSYMYKLTSARIGYERGVDGGSGVQLGAEADTISGFLGHSITREWLVSVHGAYTRTSTLATGSGAPPPGVFIPIGGDFSTVVGGIQVSRSLGRTASVYASYTVENQSNDASYTGTNAFNGTSQTLGVGISYTPRATRLGQF